MAIINFVNSIVQVAVVNDKILNNTIYNAQRKQSGFRR